MRLSSTFVTSAAAEANLTENSDFGRKYRVLDGFSIGILITSLANVNALFGKEGRSRERPFLGD